MQRHVLVQVVSLQACASTGSMTCSYPTPASMTFPGHVQVVTAKARVISKAFLSTIYATITNTTSSGTTGTSTTTSFSATSLTVAAGCVREAKGTLRLHFYVSAENVKREVHSLPGAGRRLQSTPCSATDGASVSLQ